VRPDQWPGSRAARTWWRSSLVGHGWRRFRELDLDTHALAFCAQQVLCTAPLVVAVSAVLQREDGHGVDWVMGRFFGLHGSSESAIERLFGHSSATISTSALVVAMLTAILFTTGVAAVQQRAFEMIWTLPRVVSVRSYFRQLSWTLALGIYCGAVLVLSRITREVGEHAQRSGVVLACLAQGVLTFLFYWWTQRWLLGGRVAWRALWPGALAVGIGTAVTFRLTRLIIPGEISWQVHAYGLVGVAFVLSVWLMILCGVVYAGVLFGAVVAERRAVAAEIPMPLTEAGLASVARASEPLSAAVARTTVEAITRSAGDGRELVRQGPVVQHDQT
jgi:membrane protein